MSLFFAELLEIVKIKKHISQEQVGNLVGALDNIY